MKKTLTKQAETLKNKIDSTSEKSKETIKKLIETNSKQFDSALEASTKAYTPISETLYEQDMDASMISTFRSTFGKSLKLSEEVIDTVIDSHTRRIDLSIDFTTKMIETLQTEDFSKTEGIEKLMTLLKENFNKSTELSVQNMEKMVTEYNNHLNLGLNFNEKISNNISAQLSAMVKLQKKNIDGFFTNDMLN
ncbi:MAG TPA: hypothetical protein VK783_15200 [Bacteroidia bacterium]|nr:hypothetical protein [Bacteroidia bacterium]